MAQEIVQNLSLSLDSLFSTIAPQISSSFTEFIIFTLGIALYGIIIYNFYRFVAKRDIFHFEFIEKHRISKPQKAHSKFFNFSLSLLKYGIIFPILVFFWFVGFSLILFFLAKSIDTELILLISITIVSSIRITSYYTENLSRELAKTIPLTLLGIALFDPGFFSFELVWQRIDAVGVFVPKMIAYVFFTIIVEWILRILLFAKRKVFGRGQITLWSYKKEELTE